MSIGPKGPKLSPQQIRQLPYSTRAKISEKPFKLTRLNMDRHHRAQQFILTAQSVPELVVNYPIGSKNLGPFQLYYCMSKFGPFKPPDRNKLFQVLQRLRFILCSFKVRQAYWWNEPGLDSKVWAKYLACNK